MTIKAVLFGSIGTIIETSDIQRNCFNQAFQKVGLNWYWSKKIYKSMLKKPGGEKRVRKYSLENNTTGSNNVAFGTGTLTANTTGNKSLDAIRTNQLCSEVLNLSSKILKPQGVLVSKLFMGDDFLEVKNLAKSMFSNVNFFKPESSRDESKETYVHCRILKTL